MTMRRNVAHAVVALALALLAGFVRFRGLIEPSNWFIAVVVLVVAAGVVLRRSRSVITGLWLIAVSLGFYVFANYSWDLLRWWPRSLGFLSILWVPVFAAAMALEIFAISRRMTFPRFSTVVAASANLMFLHPVGSDTSSPFDGSAPVLALTIGLLLTSFVEFERPLKRSLYAVAEPMLLVILAFTAAWLFPYAGMRAQGWYLTRYYFPAFGLPAAVAAAIARAAEWSIRAFPSLRMTVPPDREGSP
jgi:hypothetical protein